MSDYSSTTTTGITGAGGGSKIRITGMSTGLDVDALVKKMMASEQLKVDKAKQERQLIAWRQEAYQDIIKDIKDLQSSYFDSASSDKNIMNNDNFSGFKVALTSGIGVTATTGTDAKVGSYTVNVTNLAMGAGNTTAPLDPAAGMNPILLSSKLSDISGSNIDTGIISLVLNTGGSDMTVNLDNTDGKATVSDLLTAINNGTNGTVKASFSEVTKKLSVYTSSTGSSAVLNVKKESNASLNKFLFNTANTSVDNQLQGKPASFTITEPGEINPSATLNQDSNYFTLDGINYSLAATGTTSFTVSQDTQKVYDKLKGFIDKYNSIVDEIQTKITEKTNKDYKPLTDSQKSSMKDSEITTWETKAKQGILRNDNNLSDLLTDLKSSFATAVTDAGLSFGKYGSTSFGLDFSSDHSKPAHIDITDPQKLKETIEQNSSKLVKLFTNVSSTPLVGNYESTNATYKEDGVFTRIQKVLEKNVGMTNVTSLSTILTKYANYQDDYSYGGYGSSNNTLPDQLYQKDTQLKKLQQGLSDKQESYYMKFSKLETLMNQLNTQQSWLTQQLG